MDSQFFDIPDISGGLPSFGLEATAAKIRAKPRMYCCKCRCPCDKVRRLTCQHEFCKACLETYFKTLDFVGVRSTFPCPRCRHEVECPRLPVSKWTKSFKVDKRTQFYSVAPDFTGDDTCNKQPISLDEDVASKAKVDLRKNGNGNILTPHTKQYSQSAFVSNNCSPLERKTNTIERSRATSEQAYGISRHDAIKSHGSRRTAVHFHGYDYHSEAIDCRISSDKRTCQFWGGDVDTTTGNMVLADWMNQSVKIFDSSGHYVTDLNNLQLPPLYVTVLHSGIMLVTMGSRSHNAIFLTCETTPSQKTVLGMLNSKWRSKGFLYSTTRYEKDCFGIFESRDCKFSVALIYVNVSKFSQRSVTANVEHLNVSEDVELSSCSGINYCHKAERLFVTEKTHLYCLKTDGNLIYQRQVPNQNDDEYYNLGAVSTDDSGQLLVISDHCVLRLTTAGDLVTVIPTKTDPYCLVSTRLTNRFLVLGRGDCADIVLLK